MCWIWTPEEGCPQESTEAVGVAERTRDGGKGEVDAEPELDVVGSGDSKEPETVGLTERDTPFVVLCDGYDDGDGMNVGGLEGEKAAPV